MASSNSTPGESARATRTAVATADQILVATDAGRALRVFIVEDSPAVRDRLIDFLEDPGRVEMIGYAETQADAVRQLISERVDVAIVDLNLKQGTGLGVIETVRALHPSPQPVIVVLTNYAVPAFEAAARAVGADHFFDKSSEFGRVKVLLESMQPPRH
jgi:DNA-binding NarL/FixJ family response regulator